MRKKPKIWRVEVHYVDTMTESGTGRWDGWIEAADFASAGREGLRIFKDGEGYRCAKGSEFVSSVELKGEVDGRAK